jgi:ABC-type methionine transport system ATPase subunit
MSVLEMRRVSRTYGQGAAEVHALHDVELTVRAGESVAVMGPSGSGKSTLLTIAGTLEDATSGEVRIAGQDVTKMSGNGKARLRRRSIGYVFQDFNLLPGLTAAENVALPLELDGCSRAAPAPRRYGHWRTWGWPTGRITSLTSCPVASGSESPWPGPWSASTSCCWPTSPRARWTARAVRR